jgi:hypothetical protein
MIKILRQDTAIAAILTGSTSGGLDHALGSISTSSSTEPGVLDISNGEIMPLCRAIGALITNIDQGATLPFPSVTFPIYLWFSPTWRKEHKLLRTFLFDTIETARQREDLVAQSGGLMTDADCVVDMLIQQEKREGSEAFGADEMLDELTVLIVWVPFPLA